MATLEQTAYELGRGALAQQESALVELRARTGSLLSASSVAASFLGAQAIAADGLGVPTVLALTSFAASVLLSVYALVPRADLRFSIGGRDVLDLLGPYEGDERALHRRVAQNLDGIRADNERAVAQVTLAFMLASAFLAAEVVLFGLALAVQ